MNDEVRLIQLDFVVTIRRHNLLADARRRYEVGFPLVEHIGRAPPQAAT